MPPEALIGSVNDYDKLNPNRNPNLDSVMTSNPANFEDQDISESAFIECCNNWFFTTDVGYLTIMMDFYKDQELKTYIVPIFIPTENHWFTLVVDVTNKIVKTINQYTGKTQFQHPIEGEACVWFSKYFGLYKIFCKGGEQTAIVDSKFGSQDIDYKSWFTHRNDNEHYEEDVNYSSFSHSHVNMPNKYTQHDEKHDSGLWVICDMINFINKKKECTLGLDRSTMLQLQFLLLNCIDIIYIHKHPNIKKNVLEKSNDSSSCSSEETESDPDDGDRSNLKRHSETDIEENNSKKRKHKSGIRLRDLISYKTREIVLKIEWYNELLFGPLLVEKQQEIESDDPNLAHELFSNELKIDITLSPHSVTYACFKSKLEGKVSNEYKSLLEYFNELYFHCYKTYVLFAQSNTGLCSNEIDRQIYGTIEGKGIFPVSVLVVEYPYEVGHPEKVIKQTYFKKEKEYGIPVEKLNPNRKKVNKCAIIHMIGTRAIYRHYGYATHLMKTVFSQDNYKNCKSVYAASDPDFINELQVLSGDVRRQRMGSLFEKMGFLSKKHCNKDVDCDELYEHEYLRGNEKVLWIHKNGLNKKVRNVDNENDANDKFKDSRIIAMENDCMTHVMFVSNDSPSINATQGAPEEYGKWIGFNSV